MIGRAFRQVFIFYVSCGEKYLLVGRQFHVMRHVQVLHYLLRHSLEHWRCHLSALVQARWRIQDHGHGYRWIIYGSEASKRGNVFATRI